MESSSSSGHRIAVVDMGDLAVGKEEEAASPAEWQRLAHSLHDALSTIGFVYLSNHGITDALMNDCLDAAAAFFSLDEQTKMKYEYISGDLFGQGYVRLARDRLDVSSNLSELREYYTILSSEGVFPDSEVPQLKSSANAIFTSHVTLARRLLTALALGLGLERDFFLATHRGMSNNCPPNRSGIVINRYPPLSLPVPENVIRCGAHTDYGCITLLHQDSIGGLQIRSLDGKWVDVEPIPGTILINAGDMLQIWTANRIKATEHRVIVPEEEMRQRASRFSVVFFVNPDNDVVVRPIDGSTHPPPITFIDHLRNMYTKVHHYTHEPGTPSNK